MKRKKEIWFVDSTLRDGGQAPGVAFSREEKQVIASMLSRLGVQEIEVGIPAMGSEEQEDISSIGDLQLPIRLTSWCRACWPDIKKALKCPGTSIHISFPVSEILMGITRMNHDWILAEMEKFITYLLKRVKHVSVGAQDATRADFTFLLAFCRKAFACGADRIRIADTVGTLNPLKTYGLFTALRENKIKGDLEFHGHNDLGMATANTIAAIEAGATSVSVTVNGLGDRAGNAALEEVAMAILYTLPDRQCRINTRLFSSLSDVVERASRRNLACTKPIVGKGIFLHEAGIHAHGLLKNRQSYELFPAETVGNDTKGFVFGTHSGRSMTKAFLLQKGIQFDDTIISLILQHIKQYARKEKRPLSGEEVLNFCKQSYSGSQMKPSIA